ncbi:TPA: hypothetical protein ACGUPG_002786 [Vibrio vulnificus]
MAGFSNESKPVSQVIALIEEYIYVIANAAGPIGVAVFLTFVPSWWQANTIGTGLGGALKFLLWNPVIGSVLFLGITLWGAIGQARDTKALKTERDRRGDKIDNLKEKIETLSSENKALDMKVRNEIENNYELAEELVQSFRRTAHLWTCQIFNELTLDVKHRISIYYLDGEKKNLVLLDRFAKNHEFNQPGRNYFPRNQGVIGQAWAKGEFFEKKIPIFNRKNTNYYQYLEETYGFSRDVSSRLRMKSCTIGGFAIEDAQGHHIGVIIFESESQNDFDDEKLRGIVKRENPRLVEFITDASLRDIRPLPSEVEEDEGVDHESQAA